MEQHITNDFNLIFWGILTYLKKYTYTSHLYVINGIKKALVERPYCSKTKVTETSLGNGTTRNFHSLSIICFIYNYLTFTISIRPFADFLVSQQKQIDFYVKIKQKLNNANNYSVINLI